MLLIPYINFDRSLFLDAFSFSSDEINSVSNVLSRIDVRISNLNLNRDKKGRMGIRFFISHFEIVKIEESLQLEFVGEGEKTEVVLTKAASGNSYRCKAIGNPTCQTIYAADQDEANMICALLANNNKWLGGVPTPGICE